MSEGPLDRIGRRIELLSTAPERVRSRWARLARPLLRMVGWQPVFYVKATRALLGALQGEARAEGGAEGKNDEGPTLHDLVRAAIDELDGNVAGAERACVVSGRVPTSRAAWLRRLFEVIARAERAAREGAGDDARRAAAAIDPVMLAPPLAIATDPSAKGEGPASPEDAKEEEAEKPPVGPSALLDLELASIDHLLDAARSEAHFLGRKRRLLEAARRLLLDASAALPLDPEGVEARRRAIAEQIVRLDRVEGAGVAPDVGLLHQARAALGRGDRSRLYAALSALDACALERGDAATAALTGAAIPRIAGAGDASGAAARAASIERSAGQILGESMLDRVRRGYREARADLDAMPEEERKKQELFASYLEGGGELATLTAALSVDGCFEVGGALSPVRITEHTTVVRAVSYPTADLVLLPARDVGDVPSSIIEDPRSILMSLAEGRLLTRKFVRTDVVARHRTELVGEVRIYLLDGSDSMLEGGTGRGRGARARMRDAILLAELATLERRYVLQGGRAKVVLYYRYFNRGLGPITRVGDAEAAREAMVEVVRTPRRGGTDIEGALVASFAQVREAKESDPDLARAQIVLVTDGEAAVRPEAIREEREKAGDLPIAVSVIALGEENPSLRDIVARQRTRGERAYYHHLGDEALRAITEGDVDRGPALHLEAILEADRDKTDREVAASLGAELGGMLDELGALERKRHAEVMEADAHDAHDAEAHAELGLAAPHVSEGERARRELLDRDRRALEARFSRWFPPAAAGDPRDPGEGPPPGTEERDAIESVVIALSTVAEVIGEGGSSALPRKADAIEIVERLLPDARLSPARYHAVLRAHPAAARAALAAVHAAARGAETGAK